jgi:hypothetical protein
MFAKYNVDHALIMGGIMPRNTDENKVNKQIIAILEDKIYDKLLLRHRRTQRGQTSMLRSLKSLNSTMLDGALDARYHPEDALSQYVSNVGIAIIVKRQRADLTTYKDVNSKEEIQLEKPFWILERGDIIDDDALKHGISTTLYTKHYNYEDVFDDEFFIDDDEEEELEEEEVDEDEESVDDVFLNTFKIGEILQLFFYFLYSFFFSRYLCYF